LIMRLKELDFSIFIIATSYDLEHLLNE